MKLTNENKWWFRSISLAALVFAWAAANLFVDNQLLPSPIAVFLRLADEVSSGKLFNHLGITLTRVGFSFAIAMLIGTAIGITMGSRRRVDLFFDSILLLALNIPALVTIMLCYIWFGLTEVAAVLAVSINKIPMVAINMREGARVIDQNLMEVAKVYRLSGTQKFLKVYFPQLTPYLIASMRNGIALIWKIVLVVELLGRSDGMGFQLSVFFQYFDIEGILAYTLTFVAVIYIIEGILLRPLESYLGRWRIS